MKNTPQFLFAVYCLFTGAAPLHAQWVRTSFTQEYAGVCIAANGTSIFVGTYGGGVYLSTDHGDSWNQVNNGLTNKYVWALGVKGTSLFAGTQGGGVFRSLDNGPSWIPVNTGLTNPTVTAFSASGGNLYAATPDSGVYLFTDNGPGWTLHNFGLNRSPYYAWNYVLNGPLFYTYDEDGECWSTNSGATWTHLDNTMLNLMDVRALAAVGSTLFAGCLDGVYRSTNGGAHWTQVDSGLTDQASVGTFVVSGTNLIAGPQTGGAFLSTNSGTSWTPFNTGWDLPNQIIPGVIVLALADEHLYAATNLGLWRRTLSDLVSVPLRSHDLPREFSLSQNYPNPFNPSTTIRYALPQKSHVTLTVFNTVGQQIARIVDSDIEAGVHDIRFNAHTLASGLYFYLIRAGSFVEGKKLLLLR